MELLKQIYYNPSYGFISNEKLYKKAKEQDDTITHKIVNQFLDSQATNQITKQVKRNKTFDSIVAEKTGSNYQMDIMYLPNPTLNKNYKYLLVIIDVYSRYVMALPMKTKTGKEVYQTFRKIVDEFGIPYNINLDTGSEFVYKPFVDFCKENQVRLWYSDTEQENKNSIVERVHRTLRNMILRYIVANDKPYIDDLDKLIDNYNNTYHRTLKNKPVDVWEGKEINEQERIYLGNDFSIGDKVRHLVKRKTFDKASSTSTFTKNVFTITKIDGKKIFLDNLTKPFRQFEIIKAVDDTVTENNYANKVIEESKKKKLERRLNREGIKDYLTAGKYYSS